MVEVLAKTDNGIIYLRKKDAEDSTVIQVKVDLKVPYDKAVHAIDSLSNGKNNDKHNTGSIYIDNNLYNKKLNKVSYVIERINDKEIISEWLKYKGESNYNNVEKVYNSINSKYTTAPTSGYASASTSQFYWSGSKIANADEATKDGLYLIWIAQTGDNYKTVYGYLICDGLYDTGKTVENYYIPDEGNDGSNNNDNQQPDSIPLTAKVIYEVISKEIIDVTISANKPVNKVDGWTLSADGKKLTKKYTSNKREEVTLKDADGQTITVNVTVACIVDNNGDNSNNQNGANNENSSNSQNGTNNENNSNGGKKDTPDNVTGKPAEKLPERHPQAGKNLTIIAVIGAAVFILIVGYNKQKKI